MFQLSHSPLLQGLGYAIINSLWQFAFLWLIYILVNSFIKFSSHQRYIIALVLQLTGFCWFIMTAVFYYGECAKNNALVVYVEQVNLLSTYGSSLSTKEKIFSLILQAESFLPYLSLAYLILMICFTIRIIKSYRNTQTLRTTGLQKIDVDWRLFVNRISEQLGLKRKVRLYISSLVETPVTMGYLKPLILLPVAVVNNLSTEQIEAILIHEMAHIKRNDYLINILASVVEVTLFFNPFMRLISQQIKRERENSCDDWVLQYEYNACNYAKALLKIASYKTNDQPSFAVNAVDNRRALLIRVKRMIGKKDLYNSYRQQLVSLLFITAAISSLAWFAPKKYPDNRKIIISSIQSFEAEPLVAKVENPLFNPVFFLAEKDNEATTSATVSKATTEIQSPKHVTAETVKEDVETAIADQFTLVEKTIKTQHKLPEVHAVNLVLDTALFQNFATRSLVVAEIKKLKKEFESLNRSSLFQNIDWKQFWDNHKVQKQLEAAFDQLKAVELQQKKKSLTMNAVNYETATDFMNEETQLKLLATRKLASIVMERIHDIKQTECKINSGFTVNVDLPDFTQTNEIKNPHSWSYTYVEKPKAVVKPRVTAKVAVHNCEDAKGNVKEKVSKENDRKQTAETEAQRRPVRTLKVAKI